MNSGPVAQFKPMRNRLHMLQRDIERFDVLAGHVVPIGSIVPDDHERQRFARFLVSLVNADGAGFDVQRILATSRAAWRRRRLRSAPLLVRNNLSTSLSNVTPPVTDSVFVVGPIAPATKLGLSGVEYLSAASRASLAAARLISRAFSGISYSASTTPVAPNVFVSRYPRPRPNTLHVYLE